MIPDSRHSRKSRVNKNGEEMTILWCSEFLGDLKFPYPSSGGTIAYNVISRLLDKKIEVIVADPYSGRHRSFITQSGKAVGHLYATYNHRDLPDLVSRLKPGKVVTDELQIATALLKTPNCPEVVLIARDHDIPKMNSLGFTIVVVSMAMQDALKKREVQSTYIPLGVDFDLFNKIERQKKGFVFGCVCRNKSEKNLYRLMEAFRQFNENFKDAAGLAIHTDGDIWDVRGIAKHMGLKDNVFFGKWPAEPEVMNRVYNTFDVHINVGGKEWSALPVLESMACGIPQIVSDYGVLREYAEGCGALVPSRIELIPPCSEIHVSDVDEISKAMEKLWINEMERIKAGETALKKVKTYSWEKTTKQWEELLLK